MQSLPSNPSAAVPQPGGATSPAGASLHSRQRFLDACACRPLDRPPVWLMRQAGRALPEYRALRGQHSFLELVRTPELAAEVTLQPIRRFGFDAAVIFSDILVAAEALGQGYRFREQGGIQMDFQIGGPADLARLTPEGVRDRLAYLGKAIRLVRRELGEATAILGFAGSPWTLACFMMEGGSGEEYRAVRTLFYTDRPMFEALLARITAAVVQVLELQIEAGADAIQIFDSLAELLPAEAYVEASGRWMGEILSALGRRVPALVYVRGQPAAFDPLLAAGATGLSVDWRTDLPALRRRLPEHVVLQGNLDPFLLTTQPRVVAGETQRLLESMRGSRGHILNLGHGLPPGAGLDNIEALVTTVKAFRQDVCR